MHDPYAVLGVDRSASDEDIRAAYRARAMLLHPDLHEGRPERVRLEAERAMAQLTEAYETLTGSPSSPRPAAPLQRLGRLVGRVEVVRAAAQAGEKDESVPFRLGWLVGRRRPK